MLMSRQFYPMTLENVFPLFKDFIRPEHKRESNIYAPSKKESPGSLKDAVIGKNCMIHESAILEMCSLGMKARIGMLSVVKHVVSFRLRP